MNLKVPGMLHNIIPHFCFQANICVEIWCDYSKNFTRNQRKCCLEFMEIIENVVTTLMTQL